MAEPEPTVGASGPGLGELIRRQRELSALSMRQFAQMVGISNPYLSQIERGLREPSERVVEAIAETLRMSADTLYEQAGLTRDEALEEAEVIAAVRADPRLTGRQRQAMIEIYEAFTAESGGPVRRRRRRAAPAEAGGEHDVGERG